MASVNNVDYSSMSKEDLVRLLQKNNAPSQPAAQQPIIQAPQPSVAACKYRATKGAQKQCERAATTNYGFCSTHANTVQARQAKKIQEQPASSIPEPLKAPEVLPTTPVTQQPPSLKEIIQPPAKPATQVVRKNKWGHFEETKTSIVFNPRTRKACGIQRANGSVGPLTKRDIRTCVNKGWDFEVSDASSEEESDAEEEVDDEIY